MEMAPWQKSVQEDMAKRLASFRLLLERPSAPRIFVMLFIIALCIGAATKLLVRDSLTIGYDDYRLSSSPNTLDLNRIQKDVIRNGGSLAVNEKSVPTGQSCTATNE